MQRRASRNRTARPCQLGDFWLWYRADRDEWCICWYDRSARNRRRIGTGIGGGEPDNPPVEAQKALAAHFASANRPRQLVQPEHALVSSLFTQWLNEHVVKLARATTYALSVRYWEEFFAQERRAGRIIGPVTVETVDNDEIFERFIAFRKAQGVKGETIRGDLAALRGTLNYARKKRRIPAAPFVPDVDPEDRSGPRALEYSIEQVAGLLEAAWRLPERRHVHLFTLISLSTHGRTEAILELGSEQIRGGRIYFNAEGRRQTTKRRSIVPIAPALAPWLDDLDGKVIRYRAVRKPSVWADLAVPEYAERPCSEIRTAFSACLVEAGLGNPALGLCEPLLDADGNQQLRHFKTKAAEPLWRPIGSPNTLRHTLHTYLQTMGVPQAQIDAAAGHNSERGSGKNYTHLRPEYLRDFIEAVEEYWRHMDRLTRVHRRME